jgi:hypothetical protein
MPSSAAEMKQSRQGKSLFCPRRARQTEDAEPMVPITDRPKSLNRPIDTAGSER